MQKDRSPGGRKDTRPTTIRAFIAAALPAHIIDHVTAVRESLRSAGIRAKWARASNMHLTLKFLGSIDEKEVAPAGRAMSESTGGATPITLLARGIGIFPSLRRPRVIWVGLAGETEKLTLLQGALEDALGAAGFPGENRAFSAHLTVGRVRERIDLKKLSDMIERFEKFESEPFAVDRVILFKSDLKPAGPVYTELLTQALEGTSPGRR